MNCIFGLACSVVILCMLLIKALKVTELCRLPVCVCVIVYCTSTLLSAVIAMVLTVWHKTDLWSCGFYWSV